MIPGSDPCSGPHHVWGNTEVSLVIARWLHFPVTLNAALIVHRPNQTVTIYGHVKATKDQSKCIFDRFGDTPSWLRRLEWNKTHLTRAKLKQAKNKHKLCCWMPIFQTRAKVWGPGEEEDVKAYFPAVHLAPNWNKMIRVPQPSLTSCCKMPKICSSTVSAPPKEKKKLLN